MAVHKSVRNAIVSAVVLLVLLVGAGVAYTLFAYQKPVQTAPTLTAPADENPKAIKPTKPAANAQEGVAEDSLITPVKAGENTSIAVRTNATSKCTISVTYNGVASTDSGLSPKTADDYGSVSWTWTVGKNVPPGKWPVKVTCTYNGRSGVLQVDLEVTP